MVRTECPRCAFAVHEQLAAAAVSPVGFDLARVVGHVEQQVEVGVGEKVRKDPPCVVADDLAIGEGAIDSGAHCTEIALTDLRLDGGASQLPVWKRNARRCRRRQHVPQNSVPIWWPRPREPQ
jgi:hypothetical protein